MGKSIITETRKINTAWTLRKQHCRFNTCILLFARQRKDFLWKIVKMVTKNGLCMTILSVHIHRYSRSVIHISGKTEHLCRFFVLRSLHEINAVQNISKL